MMEGGGRAMGRDGEARKGGVMEEKGGGMEGGERGRDGEGWRKGEEWWGDGVVWGEGGGADSPGLIVAHVHSWALAVVCEPPPVVAILAGGGSCVS